MVNDIGVSVVKKWENELITHYPFGDRRCLLVLLLTINKPKEGTTSREQEFYVHINYGYQLDKLWTSYLFDKIRFNESNHYFIRPKK